MAWLGRDPKKSSSSKPSATDHTMTAEHVAKVLCQKSLCHFIEKAHKYMCLRYHNLLVTSQAPWVHKKLSVCYSAAKKCSYWI